MHLYLERNTETNNNHPELDSNNDITTTYRHDRINDKLTESLELRQTWANGITEIGVPVISHEKIPGQIHWILLGNTLFLVQWSNANIFFDELHIWSTRVVYIMN